MHAYNTHTYKIVLYTQKIKAMQGYKEDEELERCWGGLG